VENNERKWIQKGSEGWSHKIKSLGPSMKVHIYNSSTREAEAGGSWVLGQPGLHSKTLPQGWGWHGSSGRGPEFKLQKKKKNYWQQVSVKDCKENKLLSLMHSSGGNAELVFYGLKKEHLSRWGTPLAGDWVRVRNGSGCPQTLGRRAGVCSH
jgi:hypothetical protein